MDVRDRIRKFIVEEIAADSGVEAGEFADDESLIELGILDSLGMLKLIAFLDEEMDTNIMAESFSLEDFATLNLICGWVSDHGGSEDPAGSTAGSGAAEATAALPETTKMPGMDELRAKSGHLGLDGRTVLVTGASRGIGETIAKIFGVHGCRVVVNYAHNEQHAKRVAHEIESAGGLAMTARADVSDPAQVAAMIEKIAETWGPVDILVNNAANDVSPTDFTKLSWKDVEKSLDVVLKGAFNCCQAVIQPMLKNGGGAIVNIGSLATKSPAQNQFKYVVAKSALVGLTRSLAVDYAAHNIRVNIVSPSVVETDLVAHLPQTYRDKLASDTPMRRNATPTDVAQAVLFLASGQSGFTTGQTFMVTGGAAPFL